MTLTFYKQAATPNRVDKSAYLTEQGKIENVVLLDTRDIITPVFILSTNPMVYNANYIFCDFTQRYYYIDNVDLMAGGRIAIHCRVDVLHTYRAEILGSVAWVDRSDRTTDATDDYDMLHNDYPFRQDYIILGKHTSDSIFGTFSQSVSGINMVLLTK
jgi:hypothetical protein